MTQCTDPDRDDFEPCGDPITPEHMDMVFLHGKIEPYTLFIEYTDVPEAYIKPFRDYCFRRGYFAFFELHEEYGWVFHSLMAQGGQLWEKGIAEQFKVKRGNRPHSTERDLEHEIADYYRAQGRIVRTQVRCAVGLADIVTDQSVIEVETYLTRGKIFEAVGQVLIYRQAINPSLHAVIAGYSADETARFIPIVNQLGIEVIQWDKK